MFGEILGDIFGDIRDKILIRENSSFKALRLTFKDLPKFLDKPGEKLTGISRQTGLYKGAIIEIMLMTAPIDRY